VAAYVLNELAAESRARLAGQLAERAERGERLLVVEPVARSITPWWDELAAPFLRIGARIDEWRFPVTLPPGLHRLDRAAGLDHRVLTARTIYAPGSPDRQPRVRR
jgi:hypothetical protein